MNFPVSTYKSQNFAQSQLNFAPSHDGEKVTFRKFARDMYKEPLPSAIFHAANFLEIFEVRKATFKFMYNQTPHHIENKLIWSNVKSQYFIGQKLT